MFTDEELKQRARSILSLQEDLEVDPLDENSATQKTASAISADLIEQFKAKRDFLDKSAESVQINEENVSEDGVQEKPSALGDAEILSETESVPEVDTENQSKVDLEDPLQMQEVSQNLSSKTKSVESQSEILEPELNQELQNFSEEQVAPSSDLDDPPLQQDVLEKENLDDNTSPEFIEAASKEESFTEDNSTKTFFTDGNFDEDLPELEDLQEVDESQDEPIDPPEIFAPQLNQKETTIDLRSQEEQYRAAFEAFKNYKTQNQEMIYKVFSEKLLTNSQELMILNKIEQGENEKDIVKEICKYLPQEFVAKKLGWQGSTRESTIFVSGVLLCVGLSIFAIGYKYLWKQVRGGYYYRMGISCIRQDLYTQSDEYFEKGMLISPNLGMCLRYGNLYEEIRYLEKAKEKYVRATTLQESNLLARLGLVRVFLEESDVLEAQNAVNKALEFHPKDMQVKIALAEVFVEKGKKGDPRAWGEALQIYQDLLESRGQDFVLLAKKMRICSLKGEFPLAKDIYEFLKLNKPKLIYQKEHAAFQDFLISTFVSRYKGKIPDANPGEEQFYIIQTIRDLSNRLVSKYPGDPQIAAQSAEWFLLTGQYMKSLELLENALMLVRPREKTNAVDRLKVLRGVNLFHLGKWEDSSQVLQNLQNSEQGGLANYYLGEIHLKQTQNFAKSAEYFGKSSSIWGKERIVSKEDVLYKSAYLNYWRIQQNNAENSLNRQDKNFKRSMLLENLENWVALSELEGETMEISYFMGNVFLEMGEPELAAAQYRLVQQSAQPFLEKFLLNPSDVGKDVLGKLQILSDVCNNLGVSYVRSPSSRKLKNTRNISMKHFIDSIDIKDRLRMDSGTPKANFNRLIHPEWLQQGIRGYEALSTFKPDFF